MKTYYTFIEIKNNEKHVLNNKTFDDFIIDYLPDARKNTSGLKLEIYDKSQKIALIDFEINHAFIYKSPYINIFRRALSGVVPYTIQNHVKITLFNYNTIDDNKRRCNCCGQEISAGYVWDYGAEYYCTFECFCSRHAYKEWLDSYDDGDDFCYYTE